MDAIGVLHPLAHQTFSFAVKALAILVLEARNPDDGADLSLAAIVGHEHANKPLRINAVGLHAPSPAAYLDARRVQHMIADPMRLQEPMEPKTVIAGLIARQDRCRPAKPPFNLLPHLSD